ncbi:hypothetical protein [Streptomyces sp. SP18CS02]|nr:hypothetical protein [Streptomyces sp. SP18CS02]MEE1754120.1 hypothetical protein [Streptomyces sp. SP18CS02]
MRTFLLLIVYYVFVTPVGLLSRILNDPLARRWDRSADTYWISSASSAAR